MENPKKPTPEGQNPPAPCDRCFGAGQTLEPAPDSKGWDDLKMLACTKCRGSGQGPILH